MQPIYNENPLATQAIFTEHGKAAYEWLLNYKQTHFKENNMQQVRTFEELRLAMEVGEQAPNISYWKHGELVAERFADLMSASPRLEWKLPEWFSQNSQWIRDRLVPKFQEISIYQLWHDCGKPFCLTIDEQGKKHYPDHTNVSADIWLSLGGDTWIADLIRQDMICHTLRTATAPEFADNPLALELLITALCETHANASMFGGMDSDSFKIKWKRLNSCGKIIMEKLTAA